MDYDSKAKNIIFIQHLCHSLPAANGKKEHIMQVLLNLLNNAVDACNEVGGSHEVTITTEVLNAEILITVADNGCGIESKYMDKINDPFFTTKAVGKGTGLGLSICHTLVENQGGGLTIDSEKNSGTSVFITLPIPAQTVL